MKKKLRRPYKFRVKGRTIDINFEAADSLKAKCQTVAIHIPRHGYVWELELETARNLADFINRAVDFVEYMNGEI